MNDWVPERSPRSALGHVGFEEVTDNASPDFDQFISGLRDKNEIDQVNQSAWLFSHSGMRIPSEEVFNRSYDAAIMRRIVSEGGGFGRY